MKDQREYIIQEWVGDVGEQNDALIRADWKDSSVQKANSFSEAVDKYRAGTKDKTGCVLRVIPASHIHEAEITVKEIEVVKWRDKGVSSDD